ncbi:hypothetical protein [Spirobacillus cienkowskii]|uniref:hypothetical protein n=1 Tax=Spirobacillus cienkowskii TaxID=495820 RepID=UPI0030D5B2B3
MAKEQEIISKIIDLMTEIKIYKDNPQKVILKYQVNDEKNTADLNFSFIASDQEYNSYVELSEVEKFHYLLMELRELFAKRKPFHYWKSCVLEIDFELKNYIFNCIYD